MDSGESLQKAPPNTPEPVLRAASESDDDDGPPPPEPLSSKVPIPSAQLSLYRAAVAIRAVLLALFLRYRATHTVQHDAYVLWLTSVACECCLALSWLAAQLTKLSPTHRATRLHALEKEEEKDGGKKQHLASVDVFVTAADAAREPPLATANTVLSVLAADYPPGSLACHVSDDGADALLFEALRETARFARAWVPFCRAHGVEPRAPGPYFARGVDYLRDKVAPSFVRERRKVKREYEEFKVRLNRLAAATARARRVPEEGWVMSDGTPWPGNDPRDHPAMVQLLLGHAADDDAEANEEVLPRLVYVSREKRPGFQDHGKAGAMNALLRVSAVLTNGAYVLNLDYDHYVNNSGALREAMCFMMDPAEAGNRTCFVQFPLRPAVAAAADDAGHDSVFFNIDMKCLDGIQGPVYVGSGCCFNRKALYGFDPAVADDADDLEAGRRKWCCFGARESRKMRLKRTMSVVPLLDSEDEDEETERAKKRRLRSYHAALERHFGLSPSFIASVFGEPGIGGSPRPAAMAVSPLLTEAIINVISCAYEERTRWGREFGWIYGAGASGGVATATGFRMHARGWESAYCVPTRPAFRSYAGRSASEMLAGASRQAAADMGVLLSRHCPVWDAGSGMKPLQRLAYVNRVAYPLASLPLTVYCALSAVCLLSGKSIFPDDVGYDAGVLLVLLLSSVIASVALELKWSGVSLREWWRDEKLWVVLGTSAGLAAVFVGIIRACTGIDVAFSTDTTAASVSNQEAEDDDDEEVPEKRSVQWSNLLVPPISVLLGNLAGAVVAFSYGVDHGYESWGPLAWRLLFAAWVVAHLQGFLRGLLARRERAPTIAVLWSVLFVSILSLLWVNVQTYYAPAAATHQPIF